MGKVLIYTRMLHVLFLLNPPPYQVIKAINYMHSFYFLHRDIKPENILISKSGVVKLCDFGFARSITKEANTSANKNRDQSQNQNQKDINSSPKSPDNTCTPSSNAIINSEKNKCTDYVATRWYRAPELLVGDLNYGTGVDIWAIGCLAAELSNSLPLFPGKSDLDQLHLIMVTCGDLCEKQKKIFEKSSTFKRFVKILPKYKIGSMPLERQLKSTSMDIIDLIKNCLKMDPSERWSTKNLLENSKVFSRPTFVNKYLPDVNQKTEKESNLRQKHIGAVVKKKAAAGSSQNLAATESQTLLVNINGSNQHQISKNSKNLKNSDKHDDSYALMSKRTGNWVEGTKNFLVPKMT